MLFHKPCGAKILVCKEGLFYLCKQKKEVRYVSYNHTGNNVCLLVFLSYL